MLWLGSLGLRGPVVLLLTSQDALTTRIGSVVADCQRLVAYRQNFVGAAAGSARVVMPSLLLGVGLQTLPLLAAGGSYRLVVWLRTCTKVTIVYIFKVFGHRVLNVAVNFTFLLRSVGVIAILEKDKRNTRTA